MTKSGENNNNRKKNYLVFVYGSLKRGFGNHSIVSDSKFVSKGVTLEPVYDLVGLGGFPGALRNGENAIEGELYLVDRRTFRRLDQLESNGSMYQREVIPVVNIETGEIEQAWIYIFLQEPWCSDLERVSCSQTEAGFFVQSWIPLPKQDQYWRNSDDDF